MPATPNKAEVCVWKIHSGLSGSLAQLTNGSLLGCDIQFPLRYTAKWAISSANSWIINAITNVVIKFSAFSTFIESPAFDSMVHLFFRGSTFLIQENL